MGPVVGQLTGSGDMTNHSFFSTGDFALGLPPLLYARGAFEKVAEELEEVREALAAEPSPALEEELGDLLFAVVNLARLSGAHAMQALQAANRKFTTRFEALEALARTRNVVLGEASLEQLDALWDEVKRAGRDDARGP